MIPPAGVADPARALARRFTWTLAAGGMILLLLLASLAAYSYQRAYAQVLDRHRQAAVARQSGLEQLVLGMRDHVGILGESLRDQLAEAAPELSPGALPVDPTTARPLIVTRPGASDLSAERGDIAAAAALIPLQRAARRVMPPIRWSYVFDADKAFIVALPWVPFSAAPEDLAARRTEYLGFFDYDIFLDATIARNPERAPFWTPAYLDAGGEGLMVSHGAPVDVAGRFRAVVGADILLSYLSDYLARFSPISGTFVLVDQEGMAIAGPTIGPGGTARLRRASVALGTEPPEPDGAFIDAGDNELLALGIDGAPWRLVHSVPRGSVRTEAFDEISGYVVLAGGILAGLAALYAVVIQQFLRPAGQLADFAQRLAVEPEIPRPPRTPAIWSPWFSQLEAAVRERRRLAAANSDAEALRAAVVDAALDAIVIADSAGRVIDFNPSAERLFDMPSSEATGRQISALMVPPELRAAHEAGMERFLRTRVPSLLARSIEVEAMRADGTRFPVELVINHVTSGGKDIFAASLRDLSEARAAAAEIQRQRDALHQSEKLAAMGSLLAGVAHELNNPLSIVLGHALMLEEEAERVAPELAERAAIIQVAADRCARILRSFLGMARQRPPRRRAVAVRALIEEPVELLAYGLRTRSIEVRRDLAPGLPDVFGDADQLVQVVTNLLLNAQQVLETLISARRITITARAVGAEVEIRIADSGPGVPETLRGKIFEPFFTTKPVGTGTGIGLAVSRGIVERHGGSLNLISSDDSGACFSIRLPASRGHAEAEEPPAPRVVDAPADLRHALVIDDEAPIASLLAEIVRGAGYECTIASDGAAGRKLAEANDYDVILCDLHMPGMDGTAFLAWLERARPALAARLIFVTGDTLGPGQNSATRPVIEKPFLPSEVRRTLALVTSEQDQRGPAPGPN